MADPSRPRLAHPPRVGGEGDLEVFVADEQAAAPVDSVRWARLAESVLSAEGVRGHAELSLLFVSADDIAALNDEFLGHVGPTDVLAFPIDGELVEVDDGPEPRRRGPDRPPPDPGDLPLLLGDVVVCPEVAQAQAAAHAGTVEDELALLVVHGVLHVLGHDHAEPDEAARMRARERELLEAFHWHGPTPAGFRQEPDDDDEQGST
jgi:probable rRNA maturation factor